MFFITTSKTLMKFKAAFLEGLHPQNALMFLFSMKHSYVLTAKTTPDVNNSLIFTWCERATLGKSLHSRSNFRCLIMTSTNLIQFVVKFTRNINHRSFNFLFELPNRMSLFITKFQFRYS